MSDGRPRRHAGERRPENVGQGAHSWHAAAMAAAGFDLQHFLDAQAPVIAQVQSELRAGAKRTHWMWFVFPQIAGLGHSAMAQRYAIVSLDEAKAYAAHPVLSARLRECTALVLAVEDKSVHAIFGSPDDLKFHSCMTLFARAAPEEPLFSQALERFFRGRDIRHTVARAAGSSYERLGVCPEEFVVQSTTTC